MQAEQINSFPRIAHIITDLNGFGGTEVTLLRYLLGSNLPSSHHLVIVLKEIGEGNVIGAQMVTAGFEVIALHQKRGLITAKCIQQLFKLLNDFEPDIVSSWLYHPCLLASVLAPWLRQRPRVVWHIRSLPFVEVLKKPGRFLVQRVLAAVSHLTRPVLVSNSNAAVNAHVAIGFQGDENSWTVIPNGLDTNRYFPDSVEKLALRQELGIPEDALVLGCVGRFVPEKGYKVLFEALALAKEKLDTVQAKKIHILALGNGVSLANDAFAKLSSTSGLPLHQLHFLGKRVDVERLLRVLDIFVLPSLSESFPNSLVESMATGVACITTNVGNCNDILPDKNLIIPAGDAIQLADRIVLLIKMNVQARDAIGLANRTCIVNQFTLEQMVSRFDKLFITATTRHL